MTHGINTATANVNNMNKITEDTVSVCDTCDTNTHTNITVNTEYDTKASHTMDTYDISNDMCSVASVEHKIRDILAEEVLYDHLC